MKPNIFKTLIFVLALFIQQGCQEDFLEEVNKTGKTEDLVYADESSVDALVAGCYGYNRLWYGKEGGLGLSEGGTDLWYPAGDNKQEVLVNYENLGPESQGDNPDNNTTLDQYWEALFAAVNLCNTAMEVVQTSDFLAEDKVNQYLAETRYLRAFYYWHLVETWGAVPLNTEPVRSPVNTPTRNSVDEVYTQMFEDVEFAIANLDENEAPSARVTYWAAKAFKARLHLYYASEYYGNTEHYAMAEQEAEDVIANSGKALYDDYQDVWEIDNSSTDVNDEFIWAIDYYEEIGGAQSFNFLPPRTQTDDDGDPLPWVSIIERRPMSDNVGNGNVMHLMFTPVWNSQNHDFGGPPVGGDGGVLRRVVGGEVEFYTEDSPLEPVEFDVGTFYVKYAMGYRRYGPTKYCLELWEEQVDERFHATFRTAWYKHPDVVPAYFGTDSCPYPDMQDTALFLSKRELSDEQLDYASTRYKVWDVTEMYHEDNSPNIQRTGTSNMDEMFPMMRKFENTDTRLTEPTDNFQDYFTYRDFPIFRISEMYLIAAEAEMADGKGGEAYDHLVELANARSTDGDGAALLATYGVNGGGDVTIDYILEERAREFAAENMRWFDLKRTMKLEEQLEHNTFVDGAFDPNTHYLRPIPETQMNAVLNETNGPSPDGFWQNPGY